MKNTLVAVTLVSTLALLSSTSAQASVYQGQAYEPFDYTAGVTLNNTLNGGTGWNSTGDSSGTNSFWGSNTTGGSAAVNRGINSPTLDATATGYATETGNRATVFASGIGRTFGQTVDSGSFYFSYLTDRNITSNRTLNIAFFNGTTEQFAVGQIGSATADSGGNFALFMNNLTLVTAGSPIAYGTDITHLIIGRVDFDAALNERVRLYIDPANVTDENLLTPYMDDSSANFTAITQFRMFAGSASGAIFPVSGDFDELRFSSTFAGVTGPLVPEPSSSALLLGGAALFSLLRRRR